MEKRKRSILAVLLLIASVNYSRISGSENIRPVQFISIFVMGVLAGLLISEFIALYKSRRQQVDK